MEGPAQVVLPAVMQPLPCVMVTYSTEREPISQSVRHRNRRVVDRHGNEIVACKRATEARFEAADA